MKIKENILTGLLLGLLAAGCAGPGEKPAEASGDPEVPFYLLVDRPARALTVLERPYAQVAPTELDESITAEGLVKMTMPLGLVPFGEWERKLIAEGVLPSPRTDSELRPAFLSGPWKEAAKRYLRGRVLLGENQVSQAIEQLKAGLMFDPNSAELRRLLARGLYDNKENLQGQLALKEAVSRARDNMGGWQLLGTDKSARGEFQAAAVCLQRALSARQATRGNPMTGVIHLQLAGSLLHLGYLSAASQEFYLSYQHLYEQAGYSQTNDLAGQLVRQAHLPLLTMAALQVQLGRPDLADRALAEAREILPETIELDKLFLLSLADQKSVPAPVRYRQTAAMAAWLLARNPGQDEVIRNFQEACGQMKEAADFARQIRQWANPVQGPALLSARQYALGLSLADQDEQAEKVLLGALKSGRETALAQRDLARLYRKKERWPEMIGHYAAYLREKPEHTPLVLAELTASAPAIKDAPARVENWAREAGFHDSVEGNFLLGYLAEERKSLDLAERCYRRALELAPGYVAPRRHLAEILLEQERFPETLACLDPNQETVRREPELLWYGARAGAGLKNYPVAREYYQRIINLKADDAEAYVGMGRVLALQGHFESAEQVLLRVLTNWPSRAASYRELALLYVRWSASRPGEAAFAQRARQRVDDMLEQWLRHLAAGRSAREPAPARESRKQELDSFIAELQEMQESCPRDVTTAIVLSEILAARQDNARAVEQIEKVLAYHPEDESLLLAAAQLYSRGGDYPRAAERLGRLWQTHQEDVRTLLAAVSLLVQAQRLEAAAELIRQVDKLPAGGDPQVLEMLSLQALRVFMILREYGPAAEVFGRWQRSLAEKPPEQPVIQPAGAMEAQRLEAENLGETPKPRGAGEKLRLTIWQNYIWALTEKGDYPTAIGQAVELMREYQPRASFATAYLARLLRARDQGELCRDYLEQAIQQQPESLVYRYERMQLALELGRADEAVEQARGWWQENRDDPNRRGLLQMALQASGRGDEAIAVLREALAREDAKLVPEHSPDPNAKHRQKISRLALQLGIAELLIGGGAAAEAEALIQSLPLETRRQPAVVEAQIKLDLLKGDCARAALRLTDLGEIREPAQLDLLKCRILDQCGQSDKAAEILKQRIGAEPQNVEARLQYSTILDKMGQAEEAAAELEALLVRDPNDAGLKNNLGYLLIEAGRRTEYAWQLLEASLQAEPDSAPTLDSLGWFYYKSGDFARAWEYITQAAARMSQVDVELYDHLGDTSYRLGKAELARRFWTRARQQAAQRVKLEPELGERLEKLTEKLTQLAENKAVTVSKLFTEK